MTEKWSQEDTKLLYKYMKAYKVNSLVDVHNLPIVRIKSELSSDRTTGAILGKAKRIIKEGGVPTDYREEVLQFLKENTIDKETGKEIWHSYLYKDSSLTELADIVNDQYENPLMKAEHVEALLAIYTEALKKQYIAKAEELGVTPPKTISIAKLKEFLKYSDPKSSMQLQKLKQVLKNG